MTNYEGREEVLAAQGYSTREIEEEMEHRANAPAGSYFANALAFIVESLEDEHTMTHIESLDHESLMEFAETYNFTEDSFKSAMDSFKVAAKLYVIQLIE